jgi:hypothetical protein
LKIKLPEEAGGGGIEFGPTTQLVKASLRTRDIREAKIRYAAASLHLSSLWKSLRDGAQHLSQKQIIALARDFRRREVGGRARPFQHLVQAAVDISEVG